MAANPEKRKEPIIWCLLFWLCGETHIGASALPSGGLFACHGYSINLNTMKESKHSPWLAGCLVGLFSGLLIATIEGPAVYVLIVVFVAATLQVRKSKRFDWIK